MPKFNIHWKGCPHRHFPRIRIASSRHTSVCGRSIARTATESISRRALTSALGRERKKQRTWFYHRRRRSSRSGSAAVRSRKRDIEESRKRAALRARHKLQAFGLDASSISKVNTNDGAGCSGLPPLRPFQQENLYSSMQISETPTYWTSHPVNKREYSAQPDQWVALSKRPRNKSTFLGPLDSVGSKYYSPDDVGRRRTYDSRIDPKPRMKANENRSVLADSTQVGNYKRVADQNISEKQEDEATDVNVEKTGKNSQRATPSLRSMTQTIISDSPSCTPTRKKAIKRFTKELQVYIEATRSLPSKLIEPSVSSTTISAHTLKELKPYQAHFNSAGLAVTAADQLGKTSIMPTRSKRQAGLPTIPVKCDIYAKPTLPERPSISAAVDLQGRFDDSYDLDSTTQNPTSIDKRQGVEVHHHHKTATMASFDSDTTLMAFTPPNERSEFPSVQPKARRSLSSDHTVMAFTPPHERPNPVSKYASSIAKNPPKKSLPWLRKPACSPEVPSSRIRSTAPLSTVAVAETKPRNPSDIVLPYNDVYGSLSEKQITMAGRGIFAVSSKHSTDPEENINMKSEIPTELSKCGSCTQAPPRVEFLQKGAKTQYKDRAIQTEKLRTQNSTQARDHEIINSGFEDASQAHDSHQMSRFKSSLLSQKLPLQEASKSPGVFEKRKDINDRSETRPPNSWRKVPAPTRKAPSPFIYTQCGTLVTERHILKHADERDAQIETAPRVACYRTCNQDLYLQFQQDTSKQAIPVSSPPQEASLHLPESSCLRQTLPVEHRLGNIKNCCSSGKRFMEIQAVADITAEYAKSDPVADPMKRPSQPQLQPDSTPLIIPEECPQDRPIAPQQTPVLELPPGQKISDKAIFKGLNVATAAACDEDIDMWIQELTGYGVRKFLAGLGKFDELGLHSLRGVARRAKMQRRREIEYWERLRADRMKDGPWLGQQRLQV